MIRKIFNKIKNSLNRDIDGKLDRILLASGKQLSLSNKLLLNDPNWGGV